VSATAPEVLFVAKALRRRAAPAVAEKIRFAHAQTASFDFAIRDRHPFPCPLLADDVCSIYELRPMTCRLAASVDAAVCVRSYRDLSNEAIPIPSPLLFARGAYAIALAIALRRAQLPHYSYEFNGALNRAMEREDAERAWLSGEDVFAGLLREPNDPFSQQPTRMMYERAFG
jgi:hypothetical protein